MGTYFKVVRADTYHGLAFIRTRTTAQSTIRSFGCFLCMRKSVRSRIPYALLLLMGFFMACEGPASLFKSQYAHQRYEQQLKDAGLQHSALFQKWQSMAQQSLIQAQAISVPYQESGFFAADRPQAAGFVFEAKKGERLQVEVRLQSIDSVHLFVDLFRAARDSSTNPKHLTSADTSSGVLEYDVEDNDRYLLRVQPELLATVSYHLKITAEPSLASPVDPSSPSNIGSFFGDGRDAGVRKHEGVDIFAKRLTPVVAAAAGRVNRVGTNNLGGNIVWLRPHGKNINLYYAHLDSQLVATGAEVRAGDTLGLMGNTGNARTTPPHLHFGIYTSSGAVDPLPFLRPGKSIPPKIVSPGKSAGDTLRVQAARNSFAPTDHSPVASLGRYTPVYVEAATQNSYRVVLPDGSKGVIPHHQLAPIARPLRSVRLKKTSVLYDRPTPLSAQLRELEAGTTVQVLSDYQGFHLIEGEKRGWVKLD